MSTSRRRVPPNMHYREYPSDSLVFPCTNPMPIKNPYTDIRLSAPRINLDEVSRIPSRMLGSCILRDQVHSGRHLGLYITHQCGLASSFLDLLCILTLSSQV